jgi:DNA-binding NarL/FixJ family response regulator
VDYRVERRNHLPLEAALDVATEGTPERHAELRSDLARLAALTANLPARERELIALKYGASLNNRLIAELTGLSESNVGTVLHPIMPQVGHLAALPCVNKLIIVDTFGNVQRIQAIIEALDVGEPYKPEKCDSHEFSSREPNVDHK